MQVIRYGNIVIHVPASQICLWHMRVFLCVLGTIWTLPGQKRCLEGSSDRFKSIRGRFIWATKANGNDTVGGICSSIFNFNSPTLLISSFSHIIPFPGKKTVKKSQSHEKWTHCIWRKRGPTPSIRTAFPHANTAAFEDHMWFLRPRAHVIPRRKGCPLFILYSTYGENDL